MNINIARILELHPEKTSQFLDVSCCTTSSQHWFNARFNTLKQFLSTSQLSKWSTMINPYQLPVCYSLFFLGHICFINGYESKPWYPSEPQITGKWMFIPPNIARLVLIHPHIMKYPIWKKSELAHDYPQSSPCDLASHFLLARNEFRLRGTEGWHWKSARSMGIR